MKVVLVAIRDEKIDQYMQLFGVRSEGEARRMFSDIVNNPAEDNLIYKHPDDYAIYYFGLFDAGSGEFSLEKVPRLLVSGLGCKVGVQ